MIMRVGTVEKALVYCCGCFPTTAPGCSDIAAGPAALTLLRCTLLLLGGGTGGSDAVMVLPCVTSWWSLLTPTLLWDQRLLPATAHLLQPTRLMPPRGGTWVCRYSPCSSLRPRWTRQWSCGSQTPSRASGRKSHGLARSAATLWASTVACMDQGAITCLHTAFRCVDDTVCSDMRGAPGI